MNNLNRRPVVFMGSALVGITLSVLSLFADGGASWGLAICGTIWLAAAVTQFEIRRAK